MITDCHSCVGKTTRHIMQPLVSPQDQADLDPRIKLGDVQGYTMQRLNKDHQRAATFAFMQILMDVEFSLCSQRE